MIMATKAQKAAQKKAADEARAREEAAKRNKVDDPSNTTEREQANKDNDGRASDASDNTTVQHASDCAVNNEPAEAKGPCNCGAVKSVLEGGEGKDVVLNQTSSGAVTEQNVQGHMAQTGAAAVVDAGGQLHTKAAPQGNVELEAAQEENKQLRAELQRLTAENRDLHNEIAEKKDRIERMRGAQRGEFEGHGRRYDRGNPLVTDNPMGKSGQHPANLADDPDANNIDNVNKQS